MPGTAARLLQGANGAPGIMMCIACALMALPAARLGYQFWADQLGPNPLETLIREPGRWALNYLMGALAVAPLRHAAVATSKLIGWGYGKRLSDWNWLIRLRRAIGLAAFFYALGHLAVYLVFDLGWNMDDLMDDLRDKPYIMAGMACFVILVPLAATSTNGWMKRLQKRWKQLHYSVYAAGVLGVMHYLFLSKPGVAAPGWYAAVLVFFLGSRIALYVMRKSPVQENIDGSVPERRPQSSTQKGPQASNQEHVERVAHQPPPGVRHADE